MRFELKIKALGAYPSVALSQAEFEAIGQARSTLSHALLLEEAYDLLVSNHEEFEQQLADIAVRLMMRNEYSYEKFFAIKALISRRIANVLTAARCYVDQAPRLHARVMDSDEEGEQAVAELNSLYDGSFAYRFMEAYRNHVQHYSATTDSMSLGGVRDKATMQKAFVVEPYAEKAKLELNSGFKKAVLAEMDAKVDLRSMARGYTAAFSKFHLGLRKRALARVQEAASIIQTTIEKYEAVLNQPSARLFASQYDHDQEIESFPVLLDWESARKLLIDINADLADLERHFVTTQLKLES